MKLSIEFVAWKVGLVRASGVPAGFSDATFVLELKVHEGSPPKAPALLNCIEFVGEAGDDFQRTEK